MKDQVYRISPDGKTVQTILHDQAPMGDSAEEVTVVRASHVRFDNAEKQWFVFLREVDECGRIQERRELFGFPTRSAAIQHEQNLCNAILLYNPTKMERLVDAHVASDRTSG